MLNLEKMESSFRSILYVVITCSKPNLERSPRLDKAGDMKRGQCDRHHLYSEEIRSLCVSLATGSRPPLGDLLSRITLAFWLYLHLFILWVKSKLPLCACFMILMSVLSSINVNSARIKCGTKSYSVLFPCIVVNSCVHTFTGSCLLTEVTSPPYYGLNYIWHHIHLI